MLNLDEILKKLKLDLKPHILRSVKYPASRGFFYPPTVKRNNSGKKGKNIIITGGRYYA